MAPDTDPASGIERSNEDRTPELSRRTVLGAIGALGVGGVNAGAVTDVAAKTRSTGTTYTLTVTDSSGNDVGSVDIDDETGLDEYGGHVTFATLGDTRDDNDSGIIDQVRLSSGEVIEDWEDPDLDLDEDYARTNTGNGEFRLVGSPISGGRRALQVLSGCCGDAITSVDEPLSISAGTVVKADLRQQTDNSSTYAHQTTVSLGTDADGSGGITIELINPGTERTAGARLKTPNAEGRIKFEPETREFYTFTVEIGTDAATACPTVDGTETMDPNGDGLCEDLNGDGTFDVFDVQSFLDTFDGRPVQENAGKFNFDGEGGVTIFDVQTLLDRL